MLMSAQYNPEQRCKRKKFRFLNTGVLGSPGRDAHLTKTEQASVSVLVKVGEDSANVVEVMYGLTPSRLASSRVFAA